MNQSHRKANEACANCGNLAVSQLTQVTQVFIVYLSLIGCACVVKGMNQSTVIFLQPFPADVLSLCLAPLVVKTIYNRNHELTSRVSLVL